MRYSIDKITLKGFKSIRSLDNFELGSVNVLIGGNGSGKSNFISFFSLLREMVEGRLETAVNKAGGADMHLFHGPKITDKIVAALEFGLNGYGFSLEPTKDNRLIFAEERIEYSSPPNGYLSGLGHGHNESKLKQQIADSPSNKAISEHVYSAISSWTVYHVHDTSDTASMRRTCSVRDNERLRPDAGNLAAYLCSLREGDRDSYRLIVDTIRLVAPFFKDFKLRPTKHKNDEIVQLEWEQRDSDYPFHPSQLSDGTLRFMALTTALLQPAPPATILIDEPELGLHPQALDVLANLILQAQQRTQLIVSTQSAALLNAFEPEQIVVIDREDGESRFRRLEAGDLKAWLEEADFVPQLSQNR